MKKKTSSIYKLAGLAILMATGACQPGAKSPELIRPGHPEWPYAWVSYRNSDSLERDFADLKKHGVHLITMSAGSVKEAGEKLALARKHGMKYHLRFNKLNERRDLIESMGLDPVDALMIGGVYEGKAIDRFLFSFPPGKHSIIVEPPVYNAGFAYRLNDESLEWDDREPIAHYFPDIPPPVKAEVVVPLKPYDGEQHLKIIPASIEELPPGRAPDTDSADPEMQDAREIRERKLYLISFDLTGLGEAMLDKTGIAVYWPFNGSDKWYIFGHGTVCAAAPSTLEAARRDVREQLKPWTEANGGSFPIDVVMASRVGDECFYLTGHLRGPGETVNFPLWDYSEPAIEIFREKSGITEYPRTWGYPEVYGPDAYAWWSWCKHLNCAALMDAVADEVEKHAPGLLLFRNTSRSGVFSITNDHDGSGPELLTSVLGVVHIDPYPVNANGYNTNILRDMHYYTGLARRYDRILLPWMQAHTYGGPGGLQHVSPEQVQRMAEEQYSFGPDAVIWLGYGNRENYTFPRTRRESWDQAGEFHHRLASHPPEKPKAELAVLRDYRLWSLKSFSEEEILHPGDWQLQQWLEVWAVKHNKPYDVYEIPPSFNEEDRSKLQQELAPYTRIVSTLPWEGAWVIGENSIGNSVRPGDAKAWQDKYETAMAEKGWLPR